MFDCSQRKRMTKRGFTLLELLAVMGIMVLLMGIGLTGWFGVRRGAEMRGAISGIRTTLLLARQQAITKRLRVTVSFDAVSNCYSTSATSYTGTNCLYATSYLPKGVSLTNTASSASKITFNPVGNVSAAGPQEVHLVETIKQAKAPTQQRITVWPLTGVTKVELE